jgi:hypothetical protein
MEACLENVKTSPEKMKANLEEMETGDVFEERLNKMDTTDLEANHEKCEAMPEHQEAPKVEAAVEIARALKKWYGDQHPAVGHH